MTRRILAVLGLFVCAAALADDILFYNITWPRHDKRTGFLLWDLRAKTARPVSGAEYRCEGLDLRTYGIVEEGGRKTLREELHLTADGGTYVRGEAVDTATFSGHVRAILESEEKTDITTDDAVTKWMWDAKTKTRTTIISTDSKVSVVGKDRTLTGDGLTSEDQSIEREGATPLVKSTVTIHRNARMTLKSEGQSSPLPGAARPAAGSPPAAENPPTVIDCAGPLDINRTENRSTFQNRVCVSRPDTTLNCRQLVLRFRPAAPDGKGGSGSSLEQLLAKDDVVLTGKDQKFSGDLFEWDPVSARGKLTGKPARMTTGSTAGSADTINFDQDKQAVQYAGNAEVSITLNP